MILPWPYPGRHRGWRCRGARSRGWPAPGCRAASETPAGAVERLDLGLLVHARHQRPLRWIEVEPDDVTDLGHEQRVLRQLPRILLVRSQSEHPPDPRHHRLASTPDGRPSSASTSAWRPAGSVSKVAAINASIRSSPTTRGRPDAARRPIRPDPARQSGCASAAPWRWTAQPFGEIGVGFAVGCRQHDSCPHRQPSRTRTSPRPAFQLGTLISGQHDLARMGSRHNPV